MPHHMNLTTAIDVISRLTRAVFAVAVLGVLFSSVAFVSPEHQPASAAATEVSAAAAQAPVPSGAEDETTPIPPQKSPCGAMRPCGVVHNLSMQPVKLRRDSGSHWSCTSNSPYRSLPATGRSTDLWRDTDCFTSNDGRIFYLPAGGWVNSGEYVRIRGPVWVLPWPL